MMSLITTVGTPELASILPVEWRRACGVTPTTPAEAHAGFHTVLSQCVYRSGAPRAPWNTYASTSSGTEARC
jgi:hypothetical protein